MQKGMDLEALLAKVIEQNETKRDFVASTQESIRMVEPLATWPGKPPESEAAGEPSLVLLQEGAAELERFTISDNCHRQIASRLDIPFKHYHRLLTDHLDLVIHQVNALFEREPETRLVRTLDGTARAFLSNKYRRLDNAEVLQQTLPAIVNGDLQTRLLSSNVGENSMHVKVLFTDPSLTQSLGTTARGTDDTVQPYAVLRNSETGAGSLSVKGGFFRSFCDNGCIFGIDEAFNFSRNHVGGRLVESSDFEVFTDDTKRKQDEVIIAEVSDAFNALASVERATEMANVLRELKQTEKVKEPFAAVDQLIKEVSLRDSDKTAILSTLLRDQDFTKWGVLNAVTEMANDEANVTYERAQELEEVGSKIIKLSLASWNRVAHAEAVAA